MEPPKLEDLQKHLQQIKSTKEEEIAKRLISFPEIQNQPNLACSFYLISCTSQEPREKDLAEFLVDKIVDYVCRREEILAAGNDPAQHSKIRRKAKATFIQGRTTREAGELLLFVLLESRGIVQVLSKMPLKTSPEMYYHGLDAVHLQITENVILQLGQVKMTKNLTDGVTEALSDMETHATSIKRQDKEADLVSSYIDDSKFDPFTEFIQDIIDPYSSDRSKYGEAFAILVCSDFGFLNPPYPISGAVQLEQLLATEFQSQHLGIAGKIGASLSKYPHVNSKPTHFYIVPFRSVDSFCNLFSEVLKE